MDTRHNGCFFSIIVLLLISNIDIAIGRPSQLEANIQNVELLKENSTVSNTNKNIERPTSIVEKPIIPEPNLPREEKNNNTAIGESIKMVASQLLQGNRNPPQPTSTGGTGEITDVRTPPKVKNQQANKIKPKTQTTTTTTTTQKPKIIENSHAGIAVPVLADELDKDALIIPKNKTAPITSTTKEGLSTWILLSGNPPTTVSPQKNNKNTSSEDKVEIAEESVKPVVQTKPKQKPSPKPSRPSATQKPIFTRRPVSIGSQNKADLVASGSAVNENVMNKIKASVLASVQKNKNAALKTSTTTSTTVAPKTKSTTPKAEMTEILVSFTPTTTKKPVRINDNKNKKKAAATTTTTTTEISVLDLSNSIESKQAEIELEVSTPATKTKKTKRPTTKRKKNKNRRRKPVKETTTAEPDVEVSESKITSTNVNKVEKVKTPPKDKPITTQIYNYLSREVMPSVGVGLVSLAGLVGLAGYFLYPFSGVVRRAYDIEDRNDNLYYQNGEIYASNDGGKSEIEMLGEVLDGMPDKPSDKPVSPYIEPTQFRYPQVSPQEQSLRYRNVPYNSDANNYISSNRVGQQSQDNMKGSAYSESIHYDTHSDVQNQYQAYQQPQPVYKASDNVVLETSYSEPTHAGYVVNEKMAEPVYGQAMKYSQEIITEENNTPKIETLHLGADDIIEQQKETGYTVASVGMDSGKEPQFVVGNIPEELIKAPITVPEHGPRSLRLRRDTNVSSHEDPADLDLNNEIDSSLDSKSTDVPKMVPISEIGNLLTTKKYVEVATTVIPIIDEAPENIKVVTKEKLQIEIKEDTSTVSGPHEFIEVSTKEDEVNKEVFTPETTTYKEDTSESYENVDNNYGDGVPVYHKPFSFLGFIKNLIELKIRIGMSLLQTTTETISRYLRGMESSLNTAARASEYARNAKYS